MTLQRCTPTTLTLDANVCPAEGSGGVNALANVQKNRVTVPCTYEVMTVDDVLDLNNLPRDVRSLDVNDARLQYLEALEGRPVRLEGFMAMVKRSTPETANCGSSTRRDARADVINTDTGDPKDHRNRAVGVEITPWFAENRTDWSHTTVWEHASYHNGYGGTNFGTSKWVRIYGWLFFDDPHASEGLVGATRGTAWEVHPITRIEVLINGAWTEIQEVVKNLVEISVTPRPSPS